MPGRNGNGPMGMGPGSGRGAGNCRGRGFDATGNLSAETNVGYNAGSNRGFGAGGRGRGGQKRGWRNMFYATGLPGWLRGSNAAMKVRNQDPIEEKELLESRLQALQAELESINRRLSEIERETKE